MSFVTRAALAVALTAGLAADLDAGGTLTPRGAVDQPIQILDHHVDVTLQNGFARVEVQQTFLNPNAYDLSALYSFPVPEDGCLSEMSIFVGELQLDGEVVPERVADEIYEQERAAGNDAGKARKVGYQRFEFDVTPVRAGDETSFRFVYYQPLEIDTGVGRFVYPLEDGGTDDAARAFWTESTLVHRSFSMDVALRSAVPVDAMRLPGNEGAAVVTRHDAGEWTAHLESTPGTLDEDVVVYYKLADELPGRIEVIPYKPSADATGTYMVVVTPGIDLAPLERGADYVFVLDRSGSMSGKLHTLAKGVEQALGEMSPEDRVRIVTFSNRTDELTRGWTPCTPENVAQLIARVKAVDSDGGTNLHAGIARALDDLDADRATSVVLVTDGVANEGVVSPRAFHDLLAKHDVRVFGFLMGNGANWPLMRTITRASGGFYAGVSNADDIIGQILLAKSKVTHQSLHDATLRVRGGGSHATTGEAIGKVFRGQQLVAFGRYDEPGPARVELAARLTGEDKVYATTFDFPEVATENPELERLWAMARIDDVQHRMDLGIDDAEEGASAIEDLGVSYQLVTDETSMLVLDDATFARHGIERRNRERTAREAEAQRARAAAPVRSHRVDEAAPAFQGNAPRGGGAGSIDLLTLALFGAAALFAGRRAVG